MRISELFLTEMTMSQIILPECCINSNI